MTEYQKRIEQFRTHYKFEHNVDLDDEIIYLFIRINQMEVNLKKEIKNIPKVTFPTGWDYFLYGLGKWLVPSIIVGTILIIVLNMLSIKI